MLGVGSWAGYRPSAQGSALYPNEVSSDFAFIPFGGGARKCVGDQFALMEATVILAMLLRYACKPASPSSCSVASDLEGGPCPVDLVRPQLSE